MLLRKSQAYPSVKNNAQENEHIEFAEYTINNSFLSQK